MRNIFILLALASVIDIFGQNTEPSDTISKELEEVVVNATTVIRKSDRSIYTIDENVKERSSSALTLLRNVQIPTLSINEINEEIKSSLGTVQLRLNGREIDMDKLKTVNPENIVRIEWIDNPGLRYGNDVGAVINIIVSNPTNGGAFMVNALQAFTKVFNNNSASLTLNNGNSQWQIGNWMSFRGKLDLFREYEDRYLLPGGTVIERSQKPTGGYFDQAMAAPNASYNYMKGDSLNFYVGLRYYYNWRQTLKYDGVLEDIVSRANENVELTDINSYPWQRIPSLDVYFEQRYRRNNILAVSGAVNYSDMLSQHDYTEKNLTDNEEIVNIVNNIRSYSYGYYLEANYIREFNNNSRFTLGTRYNGQYIKALYKDYNDMSVIQRLDKIYFFGEYMIPVKSFTFTAGIGGTWNRSSVEGGDKISKIDFTPRLSVNWRASDKSRWSLTYNNFVTAPSATQLSPIEQAIDGIQIERGNPDLKSYLSHQIYLRYNFSNNRNLNISSFVFGHYRPDFISAYYTWEGDKILRSYSNGGSHSLTGATLSVSYEPLPEWLSLSFDLSYYHYRSKGKGFKHILDSWEQYASIELYHWNWSLNFDINNPASILLGESIYRGERFNQITLSYRWKQWHFGAGMFMAFGKYSQMEGVISNLVNQKTVTRSDGFNRMPFIKVTYNTNWGHQKQSAAKRIAGSAESGGAQAAGR